MLLKGISGPRVPAALHARGSKARIDDDGNEGQKETTCRSPLKMS